MTETIIIAIGAMTVLLMLLGNKTTRKTLGLLAVVTGCILCLTGIGAIIGLPAIFVGGLCLFS